MSTHLGHFSALTTWPNHKSIHWSLDMIIWIPMHVWLSIWRGAVWWLSHGDRRRQASSPDCSLDGRWGAAWNVSCSWGWQAVFSGMRDPSTGGHWRLTHCQRRRVGPGFIHRHSTRYKNSIWLFHRDFFIFKLIVCYFLFICILSLHKSALLLSIDPFDDEFK